MSLRAGTYEPKTERTVYVWPEPDVNGNGAQVTRPKVDGAGNHIGTDFVTEQGQPVKHYNPPAGFREIRSFDGSTTHVLHDENGNIVRDKTGAAVNIYPGEAVVIHPDNTHEKLKDDYSRYLFEQAHTATGVSTSESDADDSADDTAGEDELAEFRAWKASQGAK